MSSFSGAARLFLALSIISTSVGHAAPPQNSSDSVDGSKRLIASFGDLGQSSIQALATDSTGNIYVAGTTGSADLASKNAAQPSFGDARILRTTDLGVTWIRAGFPPTEVNVVVPDPISTQIIFAGGNAGIYRSADAGQSWRLVYPFDPQLDPQFHFGGALAIDPGNHLRL